mgnify:CR=1 FL=1
MLYIFTGYLFTEALVAIAISLGWALLEHTESRSPARLLLLLALYSEQLNGLKTPSAHSNVHLAYNYTLLLYVYRRQVKQYKTTTRYHGCLPYQLNCLLYCIKSGQKR